MVNIWLCPNFRCIWVWKCYELYETLKFDLSSRKQCERSTHYVNNVYSNFRKILRNFYDKVVHPYNDSIPIYIIFEENLGIIIIII
jgi:hypothetical protein